MCIFMPSGKNTDALFLHILFCVLCKRFCLATVGAMYFSCVASAAHFFVLGGKDYDQQI